MATFSKRSLDNLKDCHVDLQTIFNRVIKDFDCVVICGYRNEKDQNTAFESKLSKLRYPGSKHNKIPAMAADVLPYPISWTDKERMYFFAGYVIAISKVLLNEGKITHSVKWGGDWDSDTEVKDQTFFDLPHFELI